MDLFGNALFKPGMTLYIDPRSVGIPVSNGEDNRLVNAQAIPIGGYYNVINTLNIIQPGKFETRLKLIFNSYSPLNDPRRKIKTADPVVENKQIDERPIEQSSELSQREKDDQSLQRIFGRNNR
jgi:hypothetical protein